MEGDFFILTFDETLLFPSLVIEWNFIIGIDVHNKLSGSLFENLEEIEVELLSGE